jgi:hypothetical protein
LFPQIETGLTACHDPSAPVKRAGRKHRAPTRRLRSFPAGMTIHEKIDTEVGCLQSGGRSDAKYIQVRL